MVSIVLGCSNPKKNTIFEKSENVFIGMDIGRIESIMGKKPDKIFKVSNENLLMNYLNVDRNQKVYEFFYEPPNFLYSDGVKIYTDSIRVIKIDNDLD